MTYIGLALNIVGSVLIIITPLPSLLIIGRAIQGLSAACIMPATLAIINEYYRDSTTTCIKLLVHRFMGGGSGVCTLFGGLMATNLDGAQSLLFQLF